MCSATVGESPVYSLTFAASAILSCGVRGVPGVPKTLKRVPELPNAHDGSSMACVSSAEAMSLNCTIGILSVRVTGGWMAG
jgi:hypothetical protein